MGESGYRDGEPAGGGQQGVWNFYISYCEGLGSDESELGTQSSQLRLLLAPSRRGHAPCQHLQTATLALAPTAAADVTGMGQPPAPSKMHLGCLASFLEEFCWMSSTGIILLSWETVVSFVCYVSGQNLQASLTAIFCPSNTSAIVGQTGHQCTHHTIQGAWGLTF